MGGARSYSVDEGGGRTIPIKIETSTKPRVFSPQATNSYSVDQEGFYKHDGSQPSRSFGVRQEPPREIPVQFGRKGNENLRQIPINIESGRHPQASPRQLLIERDQQQQRQIPIDRDGMADRRLDSPREIPIRRELKQEPIEAPNPFRREALSSDHKPPSSYHSDLTDTYDERVLRDEDRHRADLKRKQMELKRDIDNVILEAIQQVPINRQTRSETQTKPGERFPRQASVNDEIITPSKVESPRQQRVDQVLQQTVDKDQMNLIQQRWEQEKQEKEERERWKPTEVGSYATLPIKKQSSVVDVAPIEQEPGSYSTLPSYKLRTSKSPGSSSVSRSYSHDPDRHYFSDAETTRRTPTWRPVASPLSKRNMKISSAASAPRDDVWTPPRVEKKTWSPAQPPAWSPAQPPAWIPAQPPVSSQISLDLQPPQGRSMHAADARQPA